MRTLVILGVLAALASGAAAYPTGSQFDDDAVDNDGASGIAFTGAPRFAGHTCDSCHTDAARRIGLRLEANPADLFSKGYAPGTVYQMRVVLTGEWKGVANAAAGDNCGQPDQDPYQPCDDNGFALEIDSAAGVPLPGLAQAGADGSCDSAPPPDADVRVANDGFSVAAAGFHHAMTAWRLCWTAPDAGTGPLTAYLAAVDGNGGDGTANFPNDPTGDDVFSGALPLLESGGHGQRTESGACSAAPGGSGRGTLWLFAGLAGLLTLLALARRRLAALLVGLCLLGGCATVHPWQKEKLAKNIMKFMPDTDEAELDLHMQEAREGSEGGYGSAGGGCGCN